MAVALRAGLVVGILTGSVAWAAPADAGVFFRAQTTATAIHVTFTQRPAASLITASLFDDAVSYAASDFETSGGSEALAAPAFPGRLVTQGPALLCSQVFDCPTDPPAYPLLADASYPRRTQDTAAAGGQPMGSGPLVVAPVQANARASATANSGRTSAGGLSLLAGTPAALTVGSSAAASAVHAVGRQVDVRVSTTVSDVGIGPLVHIKSLSAVTDIVMRAGHSPVNSPHISVDGVTVAGVAATIDEHGLHVAGQRGPSLTRAVTRQGIDLRTVGVHRSGSRHGGRSDATALHLQLSLPVAGLPYVPNPLPPFPPPFDQIPTLPGVNANGTYLADITLGAVGAAAGVGIEPTFDLGGVGHVPPSGSHSVPAPGDISGTAPLAGPDLVGGLTAPSSGSPPAVASPAPALRRAFDVLSREALENLYAVLALGTGALFLGWRATVVMRRRTGSGLLGGGAG